MAPVDSSLKVACSKVSSVFSENASFLCYCRIFLTVCLCLFRTPLRKNGQAWVDAVWHGKSPDMTLSNGAEIFLLLLPVRFRSYQAFTVTEGRMNIDHSNRGNEPSVAFPLKIDSCNVNRTFPLDKQSCIICIRQIILSLNCIAKSMPLVHNQVSRLKKRLHFTNSHSALTSRFFCL